jgi:hypothetical protein
VQEKRNAKKKMKELEPRKVKTESKPWKRSNTDASDFQKEILYQPGKDLTPIELVRMVINILAKNSFDSKNI